MRGGQRRQRGTPQPTERLADAGVAGLCGFWAGLPVAADPGVHEFPLQVPRPQTPGLHDTCRRGRVALRSPDLWGVSSLSSTLYHQQEQTKGLPPFNLRPRWRWYAFIHTISSTHRSVLRRRTGLAGSEVLDEDVRPFGERFDDAAPLNLVQVDSDAPPVSTLRMVSVWRLPCSFSEAWRGYAAP